MRTQIWRTGHQGITGEVLVGASADLRGAKAFWSHNRVTTRVTEVEWLMEVAWTERDFLIESHIVVESEDIFMSGTNLRVFPDRTAVTLEDLTRELLEAAHDLVQERDILYSLLTHRAIDTPR